MEILTYRGVACLFQAFSEEQPHCKNTKVKPQGAHTICVCNQLATPENTITYHNAF